MICPNCNKEMTDKSYRYNRFGDCDSVTLYEEYVCDNCKIECVNKERKIPKEIPRATEKQIKAVKFINEWLGTSEIPLLKHQCWKFIKENLDSAIEAKKCFYEYCYDYPLL